MPADSLSRRLLKKLLHPVLNPSTYGWLQALAKAKDIRSGSWTEPELDLIPLAVREGETVFDIGANYGLYSYHLSRAVGRTGKVVAFEPVPFVSDTFRRVARLLRFQNVELVPKGCSDRTGQVEFTLPIQTSGAISGGLAHIGRRDNERDGRTTHFPYQKTGTIQCDVVALDDFSQETSNLSFVKCDIEGAELLAMRGAARLIARCHPTVLCEINPWFLEGFQIRLEELLSFFTDQGYRIYSYDHQARPRRLKQVTPQEIVEDNYFFIHPRFLERFASLTR